MNKAELEKKHLSDLHLLAAEAGVPKYRMLSKRELIDRLAGENGDAPAAEKAERGGGGEREERPRRRRERPEKKPEAEKKPEPEKEPEPTPEPAAAAPAAEAPRPRRRRRRRFGRRGKQGVTLEGLLLPPEAGRQTLLCAESREACTALLRSVAADLAADSKGPDPVALLIDPSPEELADWKRDAPQAEIVSAGQPRHASDALAQAQARAGKGEDVILLVDSLTRLGEAYGDADAAKEFFDAGRAQGGAGGGSLTVVAALERSES
ncbi:MAG TPA: Rho termination factor N-terminal domain-containing protein [Solirubrobacterales bacterium]|nr:Rho termination factor N-terminal domain-containing protein [Solirubrobacterales bacterium]